MQGEVLALTQVLKRPIHLHVSWGPADWPEADIYGREHPGVPIALFTMQLRHSYGKQHYVAAEVKGGLQANKQEL